MKLWRKVLDQDKVKPIHGQVEILKDRCKGCRFCIEFCPRQVLEESTEFNSKGYHPVYTTNPDDCVNCGLCELICPEFAIRVTLLEEEKVKGKEYRA
jgi:2-oxoglutarate ferredoxin oxidoreductase subunit delta